MRGPRSYARSHHEQDRTMALDNRKEIVAETAAPPLCPSG